MQAPFSQIADPLLGNPINTNTDMDYNREIEERMKQLQMMKERYNSNVRQSQSNSSIWAKIDEEIRSLNNDQRSILFSNNEYVEIDNQLKILIQEALINSVKGVVENSEVGNKLLTRQLNLIKNNKDRIIEESNREIELFKKFQIAARTNPQLTYADFIKSITQ